MNMAELRALKDLAEDDRDQKWGLISCCLRYTMPNESRWEIGQNNITDQTKGIYDSTAVNKSSKLGRKLVNMFFPTNVQWGGLQGAEDEVQEVKAVLNEYGETVYKIIQQSNLNKEALPFIQNWSSIGTGGIRLIYTGDLDEPVSFKQLPLKDLYFLEDGKGRPETTFFRNNEMRKDQVLSTWPDAINTEQWDNPTERRTVWESSYRVDKENWKYVVMDHSMEEIYVERDLTYNPFIVTRYMKFTDGSVWGYGAANQCLSSIINANLSAWLKRGYGKLGIKSPQLLWATDQAMDEIQRTKIQLGKWHYMGNPGESMVQPFQPSVNPQAEFIALEDDQMNIGEAFFESFITRRMDEAVKTATEWNYQFKDFMEVFAANYNMFEDEALIPIYMGVFEILMSINYDGMTWDAIKDMKINSTFTNKLTENEKVEKIENMNQYLMNITQQFGLPAALIMVKVPEVIAMLAEWYNIDPELVQGEEGKKMLEQYIMSMLQGGGGQGGQPA